MTLEELYSIAGGNCRETVNRFGDPELVKRFVRKFVTDKSLEQLHIALDNEENENAFRYSHALKSVCANLGFGNLLSVCIDMTELLRRNLLDDARSLFPTLEARYNELIDAISKL